MCVIDSASTRPLCIKVPFRNKLSSMCKSTHTSWCKIEKVHIFTHFCSKSIHISPFILLCISIIAIVTMYIYTVIVAFYLIFFFFNLVFLCPLSFYSLYSSTLFLLYLLLNPTTNLYKSSNYSNLF